MGEVSVSRLRTLRACSKVLKLSSNAPGSQKPVIVILANAGGAFGAHGNGASSIEKLHLPYKYQAFLSCVCTLIFSVKVHKTMNFVAVQKQRQSQWRRYTGVVVLQFYGKSSASLVLQYCLYSIVWHVFLYKARVVIRKKSPTSPIISLSRHSFQRPKGQSLPRCERWINPSWLSNSAFWKKCFEQKGCQLNTQSHQPKRTPIRSQRCDVYFSSPSSTVVTSKEQGFVILEMFSTYQAGLAISWTLVSSEFCQRWTH